MNWLTGWFWRCYAVTYDVTDSSGNTNSESADIEVPVITLSGSTPGSYYFSNKKYTAMPDLSAKIVDD